MLYRLLNSMLLLLCLHALLCCCELLSARWCLVSIPPICSIRLSSVIPPHCCGVRLLYCCVVEVVHCHLAILCEMSFLSTSVTYVHGLLALVLALSFSFWALLLLLLPSFSISLSIGCLCFVLSFAHSFVSFSMSFAGLVFVSVAFSFTVAFQKSPNVWDQASALRASFVTFSFCGRDSFAVARSARAWLLCCLHSAKRCCCSVVLCDCLSDCRVCLIRSSQQL